jgi:hypothetical protein
VRRFGPAEPAGDSSNALANDGDGAWYGVNRMVRRVTPYLLPRPAAVTLRMRGDVPDGNTTRTARALAQPHGPTSCPV